MGRTIRILVVEDFAPFRDLVCSILENEQGFRIVGEAEDGLGAIEKAKELSPDLVLLDIGLPKMSGIEAARRIRESIPGTKILFLSQHHSWSVVEEGLRSGAVGYVVKTDVGDELIPAVRCVLEGRHYVSTSFAGDDLASLTKPQITGHHEVGFYTDDRRLVEAGTDFIAAFLNSGNSAIVVATEAHRQAFPVRLSILGIDIDAAIREGRYVAADAPETLSSFLLDGMPDRALFLKAADSLVPAAARAARGPHPRVGIFGECVHLLCAEGNAEGAIQIEKFGNDLINLHDVEIFCAYSVDRLHGMIDGGVYRQIREAHTTVHFH